MKQLFIAIPLILICLAVACKKVSGPADAPSIQPNNNLDSTVSVSATINGVKWATDSAVGYNIQYSGSDSGVTNLLVTATANEKTANPTTITFSITNFTGPATYAINPPINTATYYVGNLRNFATKGSIVVTADTPYALKGTFNFVADTFTVTNGVFNVAVP